MTCVYWTYVETLHPLGVNPFVDDKVEDMNEKKIKTNVRQSDVNWPYHAQESPWCRLR